jgi:3-dehydroquinate dehydratase
MKKRTFLNYDKPIITSMVQADNPDRIEYLVKGSVADGAEALGMQFCRMKEQYKTKDTLRALFAAAGDLPVYVTNYRQGENAGKSDDILARELVELAECGATLCDVMGDYFDRTEGEMTYDERAIEKQMALIDEIHAAGGEVVMSSHVLKFIPAEQVLKIALEHQRRGADICKIVTGASNMEEQIENLRIVTLLDKELDIPFLFLSGGESKILRRIGGELGCCMYLCVHEHDELATAAQPLISEVKAIRDNMR